MPQQKPWRTRRQPVSVLAEMALRKEFVAERLAQLRAEHGLTQEQAAAKVEVNLRQWQRWEAGDSMPYSRNLDTISSRFGISVEEFFNGPTSQLDRIEQAVNALHAAVALLLDQQQVEETRTPASQPATPLRRTGKRNGGTGTAG